MKLTNKKSSPVGGKQQQRGVDESPWGESSEAMTSKTTLLISEGRDNQAAALKMIVLTKTVCKELVCASEMYISPSSIQLAPIC